MSDSERIPERSASGALLGAIILAVVLGIGGLVWCYTLQGRLATAEASLVDAGKKNDELADKLNTTNARLSATAETLSQNVGATQKQIDARADAIMAAQKAESAQTTKLAEQQQQAEKQIGAVSTDVASVKTDVANTRSDLETTKSQLQRVVGDAGVMSGLIATNHSELEELKHKGDRNYYEFSLQKGAQPTLLSTIKLQVKKVDVKHSRYTLEVSADDRNIEKKDKNLDEPVQFYTGKDPVLFELVVNDIEKNKVSGYLSTPKTVGSKATP